MISNKVNMGKCVLLTDDSPNPPMNESIEISARNA